MSLKKDVFSAKSVDSKARTQEALKKKAQSGKKDASK